jgi:hypothetical protein
MANLSLKAPQRGSARQVAYVGIAVAIAMWSTVVLLFAINIVPIDVYWMSYYAVDYTFGFVRRGLAGELVGLVPGHYFAAALGLRWLSTAIYLCGLALVMGVVLVGRRRSERRLMVALLIPLLPFGIPFAAYSARPDLFGAAALTVFVVALAFSRARAFALAWCTLYGLVIAALTLVHEAIGMQFAMGAVLAIVVLGGTLGAARRRGVLLAVAPGVLTALGVAAFGRDDIAVRRYRITRFPIHGLRSRRCRRLCSTPSVPNRVKPIITTGCAATSCRSTTTGSWTPCALSRTSG